MNTSKLKGNPVPQNLTSSPPPYPISSLWPCSLLSSLTTPSHTGHTDHCPVLPDYALTLFLSGPTQTLVFSGQAQSSVSLATPRPSSFLATPQPSSSLALPSLCSPWPSSDLLLPSRLNLVLSGTPYPHSSPDTGPRWPCPELILPDYIHNPIILPQVIGCGVQGIALFLCSSGSPLKQGGCNLG